MNKDELVDKVVGDGLAVEISENYLLTEKYKQAVGTVVVDVKPIEVKEPKVGVEGIRNLPSSIELPVTSGTVLTVMVELGVPFKNITNKYVTRTFDAITVLALNKLFKNNEYDWVILQKAIKDYYKLESPKVFSNLLSSNDIETIYRETASSNTPKSTHTRWL